MFMTHSGNIPLQTVMCVEEFLGNFRPDYRITDFVCISNFYETYETKLSQFERTELWLLKVKGKEIIKIQLQVFRFRGSDMKKTCLYE